MNEAKKGQTNTLPVLRQNLEYIPVSSNPLRRVHMSVVSEESAVRYNNERVERQESFFDAVDRFGAVFSLFGCAGMVFLMCRLACGM